jgi:hypothetical protein
VTSAVFVMDEILVTDNWDHLEGQRHLYEAFAATHQMVVVSTHPDREMLRSFLSTEHYRYDMLLNKEATSALTDVAWKIQSVRDVRAMGWPVGVFLDCDPEVVKGVYADGTTALLLAHRLVRPMWLPDARQPKSWTDLVAFIEEQRDRRAAPEPGEPRPWDRAVVP